MKQGMLHILILVAIGSAVFLTQLGSARLWDRDEPRNAGCASEMLARSDWVVPIFNDELRHFKPVLLYWLIMGGYFVFGENEFGARIGSALLAIGTVLATYGIGYRLMGRAVGLLAGIALASNLMFTVAARAATPDSVLIFCVTMALLFYVAGTFSPWSDEAKTAQLRVPGKWFPQNYFFVVAIYVMLGLAVLAKGPVGFLLPMATMGLFCLIQRRHDLADVDKKLLSVAGSRTGLETHPTGGQGALTSVGRCLKKIWLTLWQTFHPMHFLKTLWAMRPWTAAMVVLLVAAPWYVWVHIRTEGDFTQLFFLNEHFTRATTAMEDHRGGIWFYPLSILIGFFPWSMFWGPVAVMLWKAQKTQGRFPAATSLALCWIAVQVGAFSLAQTKLPSYVTPCYPALALLVSGCLVSWLGREGGRVDTRFPPISMRWINAALAGMTVGGVLIVMGLGYAANQFFPQHLWLAGIGLLPFLGGVIAMILCARGKRQLAVNSIGATAVLFCVALFGFGTVAVDSAQHSQHVLDPIAGMTENQLVASYRTLESSWVFYGQRPIYECAIGTDSNDWDRNQNLGKDFDDGLQDGLNDLLVRKQTWKPKPRLTPETLLRWQPGTVFLTTDEHVAELKKRLPEDFEILQTANYFLKDRKIVLLGRNHQRVASNRGSKNR